MRIIRFVPFLYFVLTLYFYILKSVIQGAEDKLLCPSTAIINLARQMERFLNHADLDTVYSSPWGNSRVGNKLKSSRKTKHMSPIAFITCIHQVKRKCF